MAMLVCSLSVILMLMFGSAPAAALQEADVPQPLRAWQTWVLHGQEKRFCPALENDAATRVCVFPSAVTLRMQDGGARFSMDVEAYARGRVQLPYAAAPEGAWPQDVSLEGKPGLVQEIGGAPSMLLEPGAWHIEGFLPWREPPEVLQLPESCALVSLIRPDGPDSYPDLAPGGKLRLSGKSDAAVEERPEDGLSVRIFRLVQDDLPMRVVTLLRLEVSGRARRVTLDKVLPPDSEPLAVQSPLPLGFAPQGGVYVQVRPGRFDLRVTSRMAGPVDSLTLETTQYGREFWAFEARESLRVVEIEGVPGVDPQTTEMPQDWQGLPTYLVEPGNTVVFKAMHRGAPDAAPDEVNLMREFWLDFDGRGLTVRDHMEGRIRNDWDLAMLPPGVLGRVTLQGKDQPIVLLGEQELPGVELRQSNLQLTAEARYEEFTGTLPSGGWDRECDSVSAVLHLPPGWRLLAATGMDGVEASWIGAWSLLDIFLCLVIVLAIVKLRGLPAGIAALVFLTIAYQEPGAPQLSWLPLLAALGLYTLFTSGKRFASAEKGRRFGLTLYGATIVAMLLVAVPFVYQQVNTGLYPQLERVWRTAPPQPRVEEYPAPMGAGSDEVLLESEAPASMSMARRKNMYVQEEKADALMYDPDALVQTGPGLPRWSWRTVHLTWNGPVARGETMNLVLLSPVLNSVLCFARVVLLALVLASLIRLRPFKEEIRKAEKSAVSGTSAAAALLVLCLFTPLAASATQEGPPPILPEHEAALPPQEKGGDPGAPARGASLDSWSYPPQTLLEQLRERLLEPEPCFPECVSSPSLALFLDAKVLRIEAEVHVAARTAIPLPRVSDRWLPARVLVDGEAGRDLFRRGEDIYVALEPGVRQVALEGPAPRGLSFQVTLPLASKMGRVEAPGWNVQGLGPAGVIEGSLRLARNKGETARAEEQQPLEMHRVPPFLEVEREFVMGLEWEVLTRVRRLSPVGEPIHVRVPLMAGEAVLSDGVRVEDGDAVVQLSPQQTERGWRSRLEKSGRLVLRAPEDVPWVERWRLSPSNIWHLDIQGIPAVEVLGPNGEWRPTWRPWPGETVTVEVTRPHAAPGASMTIESAVLEQRVGQRLDQNTLTLVIRASKGERHAIALPADAELTGLTANGRNLPLVQGKPGEVEFPVQPGGQTVEVRWRQQRDTQNVVRPPNVDLRYPAVNAELRLEMPRDRWLLLTRGGPLLGPAVTYWTYLFAAVVFALGLGFLPWAPLKHWQWFLLAVGLSQLQPGPALLAVAWLPLLGLRREHYAAQGWFGFDVTQLLLVVIVGGGLIALYTAVERGLLGVPSMQVAGNNSYAFNLVWTQDRVADLLPRPVVYSAPMWIFRVVMLVWSLWLAVSLLSWLRWGWECFSQGGAWRGPRLSAHRVMRREERRAPDSGRTKEKKDEEFRFDKE